MSSMLSCVERVDECRGKVGRPMKCGFGGTRSWEWCRSWAAGKEGWMNKEDASLGGGGGGCGCGWWVVGEDLSGVVCRWTVVDDERGRRAGGG